MEATKPRLLSLATKSLPQPCRLETLAYCPMMDLVALATVDEVQVYRLNGEKVFGVACAGEEAGVQRLTWRGDGRMLAIASSDYIVRLVDVWTGKVVHRLSAVPEPSSTAPDAANLTCLAYATISSSTSPGAAKRSQPERDGFKQSLEDLLGLESNGSIKAGIRGRVAPDLPRELAMMEIESSLPKLSTLPATGADDDIFSTRASIDAIFHSHNHSQNNPSTTFTNPNSTAIRSSDTIDVLLVSSPAELSSIHILIFDSFTIGNVPLASALPPSLKRDVSGNLKVLRHTSHPQLSTHFLVIEILSSSGTAKSEKSLHLLSLHLNFLPSSSSSQKHGSTNKPSSHALPILATKATQLQNLLRYLTQIQSQLAKERQLAFELPGRFLSNIYTTLAEKEEEKEGEDETGKQARGKELFEAEVVKMVVTGVCSAAMREWLVDEMGERGLKRWERGVNEGLEVVRRGVAECVLPVLERCAVVVSRLAGLAAAARLSGGAAGLGLGLDGDLLERVQGTIDAAVVVGHDTLRVVAEEMKGFKAWSSWVKWVGEVEGCETEERKEELREAGADGMEWLAVLGYVKGGLGVGKLGSLIGGKEAATGRGWDERRFYDEFKMTRRAGREVPGLGELVARMASLCSKAFEGIAASLRKSVLVGYVGPISTDFDGAVMDAKVLETAAGGLEVSLIARSLSNQSDLLYAVLDTQEKTGRAQHLAEPMKLDRDTAEPILDLRFLDNETFLVLASTPQAARLYSHATHCSAREKGAPGAMWDMRHEFDAQSKPAKMAVNGRKGRSVVCVLEEGGLRFEVLDLEAGAEQADEESDEEQDEEMLE